MKRTIVSAWTVTCLKHLSALCNICFFPSETHALVIFPKEPWSLVPRVNAKDRCECIKTAAWPLALLEGTRSCAADVHVRWRTPSAHNSACTRCSTDARRWGAALSCDAAGGPLWRRSDDTWGTPAEGSAQSASMWQTDAGTATLGWQTVSLEQGGDACYFMRSQFCFHCSK